jgi:hypothetical protein
MSPLHAWAKARRKPIADLLARVEEIRREIQPVVAEVAALSGGDEERALALLQERMAQDAHFRDLMAELIICRELLAMIAERSHDDQTSG